LNQEGVHNALGIYVLKSGFLLFDESNIYYEYLVVYALLIVIADLWDLGKERASRLSGHKCSLEKSVKNHQVPEFRTRNELKLSSRPKERYALGFKTFLFVIFAMNRTMKKISAHCLILSGHKCSLKKSVKNYRVSEFRTRNELKSSSRPKERYALGFETFLFVIFEMNRTMKKISAHCLITI
jgi:hypothetical protein